MRGLLNDTNCNEPDQNGTMSKQYLKKLLDSDEVLTDFYVLLEKPRFYPKRQELQNAIRETHRRLLPWQNHEQADKRKRALRLLNLLGQASHVLSHDTKWIAYDKKLVQRLHEVYCRGKGDGADNWDTAQLRKWLIEKQNVHEMRVDDVAAKLASMSTDTSEGPKPSPRGPKRGPRQRGELKRRFKTVGVDLGTTYSSIAYIDEYGDPRVVNNSDDHRPILPSAVFFDGDDIIVGEDALSNACISPGDVVQFMKRQIGEPKSYLMGDSQREYTPETISAMVLKKLIGFAEPEIGPIDHAVITVPAFFNEKRRTATEHAGRIAGLEVPGVLNEPSAALIAYGLHDTKDEKIYAVYDLGGGTFDVTIMQVGRNCMQELATDGNRKLGGCDWDEALVDYAATVFKKEYRKDPREDPMSYQKLLIDCRKAKLQLSQRRRTALRCDHAGKTLTTEITREKFEKLTRGLLAKTELTLETCVRAARCDWNIVDGVILVGGSTSMPMVQDTVRRICGKEPLKSVNPELAVALGAATYAGVLETRGPLDVKLLDRADESSDEPTPVDDDLELDVDLTLVNSHGIGIFARKEGQRVNVVMIPKNTKLPTSVTQLFRVNRDNAPQLRVTVTEGDTDRAEACEVLGTCVLGPLPQQLAKGSPVELRVGYNKDGRLQVSARCVSTKEFVHAQIQTEGILAAKQVEKERLVFADLEVT